MKTALGADSLLGLAIDRKPATNGWNVGQPGIDPVVVTPPSTKPTTTAVGADGTVAATLGAPGNLSDLTFSTAAYTGAACTFTIVIDGAGTPDTFKWRKNSGAWTETVTITGSAQTLSDGVTVTFGATTGHTAADQWVLTVPLGKVTSTALQVRYAWRVGGLETSPSPWSDALSCTAKQINVSVVANCADSRCTEKILYGTIDGGVSEFWMGSIYNNSTTTFKFDIALDSDVLDWTLKAKATNETGANFGLQFVPGSNITLAADYKTTKTNEVQGSQNVPVEIDVTGQLAGPIRTGVAVAVLTALFGSATETSPAAGVKKYAWSYSVSKALQRSLTALLYYGADLIPEWFYGLFVSQMQLSINGGQLTSDQATIVGCHHGESSPGTVTSITPTWDGTVVARGLRGDALAETDDVYIKFTDDYDAGTGTAPFKVKVGDTATYDGTAYTAYFDDTAKKQIKGGTQESEWITIHDENGVFLGMRQSGFEAPYQIMFIGDPATILTDLELTIPRAALIPGGTGTGYTAVPPHNVKSTFFGASQVAVQKNGVNIKFFTAQATVSVPRRKDVFPGPEAAFTSDQTVDDVPAAQITLTRPMDIDAPTWRKIAQKGTKFPVTFLMEGVDIYSQPGVLSGYREKLAMTFGQCLVTKVASPISNQKATPQSITVEMERPDDSSTE